MSAHPHRPARVRACSFVLKAASAASSVHSLPPLAAELGFTRVRPVLVGGSRIYPTSAGGIGRGHATRSRGHAKRFICTRSLTPSPTPRNRGREQTEFAARADSPPHENAL